MVVECDQPHHPLQDGSGAFHQMVRQLGDAKFRHLAAIAEDTYHRKFSRDGVEGSRAAAETNNVSMAGASENGFENPAFVTRC